MSLAKKLKKVLRWYAHSGMTRRQWKNVRKKVGLTSKNRFMRKLKRSFSASMVSPYQPTSASSAYQHQSRTLSQLTGGV